jgi:hypothetical protein
MKILTLYTLLAMVLANVNCTGLKRQLAPTKAATGASQAGEALKLTEKEDRSIDSVLDDQLLWHLNWQHPIIACQGADINFLTRYQELAGQTVDVKLLVSSKYIFLYIAPLHVRTILLRDAEHGLLGRQFQYFCQSTSEEAISWFETSDQPLLENQATERKARKYLIPTKSYRAIEPSASWKPEKRLLFEKISHAISNDLAKIDCHPNKTLSVSVPHFGMTDPQIYFLASSRAPRDEFLGWAKFSKDAKGEYIVAVANERLQVTSNSQDNDANFHQTLARKVKQLKVAELTVSCRQN